MSHFLSLVMVINSLSIDPECLNLPQKYLTIYMAPFLSFVSSTSKETPEWRKKWWYFLDRKQLSCKFPFCYIQKNEKESKCKLGLVNLKRKQYFLTDSDKVLTFSCSSTSMTTFLLSPLICMAFTPMLRLASLHKPQRHFSILSWKCSRGTEEWVREAGRRVKRR